MKHLLGSLLAVAAFASSSFAYADAACTNLARDVYSARLPTTLWLPIEANPKFVCTTESAKM